MHGHWRDSQGRGLQIQQGAERDRASAMQLRAEADNIWAIIDLKACTVEQRWTFPSAQALFTTPGVRRPSAPLTFHAQHCQAASA